ncbi:hypothetical protein G7Y89_g161 [Cudoniella acicularis]|uniref:Uncharacterized protein n=1 Tax=Cudoniella acicularis TaxID=354080 RepID=A0A8H4W8K4_9HELO|nr:hypothetical protein G7Y89_g161 [Cudoniella acicularis]
MALQEAIPSTHVQSLTTLSSSAATSTPDSVVSVVSQTTAASVQVQTTASIADTTTLSSTDVAPAAAAQSSVFSAASVPPVSVPVNIPPVTTSAAAVSTTLAPVINTSSPEAQTTSISSTENTASKGTTPTTSSSTPVVVAQSEVHTSPTPSTVENGGNGGFQSLAMSIAPTAEATVAPSTESSAAGGISSNPRLTAAPVVGGVLGSMGLLAGLALLFWFLRRRRKVGRESLLTPLTTGKRTEFYATEKREEAGSGYDEEKWDPDRGTQRDRVRAVAASFKSGVLGIGSTLKSKVVRDRSDTPSVDLNRGHSQFLDGPIPQHSRNNSVLSNHGSNLSVKDRFNDWWDRFREDISSRIRMRKSNEPADPFAAARSMTEQQAKLNNPVDFDQLLGMDDRELQLQADRRRADLGKTQSGASLPPLGSLGLDFASNDPFADPQNNSWQQSAARRNSRSNTYDSSANPFADPSNPFSDPISLPQPSFSKQNNYIADIRRSRGQSIDATHTGPSGTFRPPSATTGPASRYPSSLAPSRDSYRDTVFSSFSGNARKGKGRSDPFDLERPELWRRNPNNQLYPNPLTTSNLQGQQPNYGPRVTSTQRIQSNATYESKYSSGVSSLGGWGDPGPDLGPGSQSSSMRGNASSSGGSGDFSTNGGAGIYREQGDGNVSPISFSSGISSKGGVGKAM